MCGIIGYAGTGEAVQNIMHGLSVLEYRGYDSAGIAVKDGGSIEISKCEGRIKNLKSKMGNNWHNNSKVGIGHTRWATHGAPTDRNAHPHRVRGTVLVHNGIIENYSELKEHMRKSNYLYKSDTDTEVAALLISHLLDQTQDPIQAIRRATEMFRGTFAFAVMFEGAEEEIYAVRRNAPLLLGRSDNGYFISSDMTALLPFAGEFAVLNEESIAKISSQGVTVFSECGGEELNWFKTDIRAEVAQKCGFEHFMLKEIYEQPQAIKNSLIPRIKRGLPDFSDDICDREILRDTQHIDIIACGSAMHAGLVGAFWIEKYAKIPVSVHIASEYRYSPPVILDKTLVIAVSQSGETADTLAALRYAKDVGCRTLAIVNVKKSAIAQLADDVIYTCAGPEIAVATTKGYATQVAILHQLALFIGILNGNIDKSEAAARAERMCNLIPEKLNNILAERGRIRKIAEKISKFQRCFYIGRGIDYKLAMEAALKLKEISYIHAEAYAAGELKHGTISLIERETPVIAIATNPKLYEKTAGNLREAKARGAYTVIVTSDEKMCHSALTDDIILIDSSDEEGACFLALAVVQLLAYEAAYLLGCDIDKPRNLAKSVTVE